jgi:transposase
MLGCALGHRLLGCIPHQQEQPLAAPYAQDLRDRILAAYDRGKQTRQIAGAFAVSPAWARRVKQVRREQQRTAPLPMGGARVEKVNMDQLRHLVTQQPDATIPELHQRLGQACCSESAVGAALRRLGLTFKKRRSMPPSKTAPTSRTDALRGKNSRPRLRPDV